MAARFPLAVGFGLILGLLDATPASAGEVRLTFQDGRVTLHAQNVLPRDVLAEWERVGGMRVDNLDALSGSPVTFDLVDVTERNALAIVLRSAAGYLAFTRTSPESGASRFARLVIMPGAPSAPAGDQADQERMQASATPVSMTAAPATPAMIPAGIPGSISQGRTPGVGGIVRDGRAEAPGASSVRPASDVGSSDDDVQDVRSADADPPFEAVPGPPRFQPAILPGQAPMVGGSQGQAAAEPAAASEQSGSGSASPTRPATQATPTVGSTAALPGTMIPVPPPPPAPYVPQQAQPQTTPPKPPGI